MSEAESTINEPISDDVSFDVEVRVAATPQHLSAIRAVAADLAMRADFDLDAIADLKLAVDEACSTLVMHAASGTELSCAFRCTPDEIAVRAVVPSADGTPPRRDTFSWRVLSTLADFVTASVSRDGTPTRVRIDLVKKRTTVVNA
ncbi:ATP-binding protein [Gandjariella thermophila]|uniref:Anti-sigma regulatory factor n=1 Tax=Gandjariella thermophila TaxID=1931992 RepID=A0A4D4J1I9_9PSEU|nr:ATP-binding protein [Gandjariella thermophila]GDY28658.1 anti-sigma regulatory factor [Gandjariella thermophila]